MQVFDLTKLRNVANPPTTFTEDAHYDGFGNAHNIVINPSQAFAYAVGRKHLAVVLMSLIFQIRSIRHLPVVTLMIFTRTMLRW